MGVLLILAYSMTETAERLSLQAEIQSRVIRKILDGSKGVRMKCRKFRSVSKLQVSFTNPAVHICQQMLCFIIKQPKSGPNIAYHLELKYIYIFILHLLEERTQIVMYGNPGPNSV